MFNSYYCNDEQARPIQEPIEAFSQTVPKGINVASSEELSFTAAEEMPRAKRNNREILMNYRIAYLGETMVEANFYQLQNRTCNDEVVDVSGQGRLPRHSKEDASMVSPCICLCTTLAGRTRYHRLDRIP